MQSIRRWGRLSYNSVHSKQGSTFFPALIADTIRALNILNITLSKYLEQCVSLLQLWFLEQIIAYRPLVTKSLFQEDLI